jgi:hypothetical protein
MHRLATAKWFRTNFVVATGRGFGRRDPSTLPELLHIHAQVAAQP